MKYCCFLSIGHMINSFLLLFHPFCCQMFFIIYFLIFYFEMIVTNTFVILPLFFWMVAIKLLVILSFLLHLLNFCHQIVCYYFLPSSSKQLVLNSLLLFYSFSPFEWSVSNHLLFFSSLFFFLMIGIEFFVSLFFYLFSSYSSKLLYESLIIIIIFLNNKLFLELYFLSSFLFIINLSSKCLLLFSQNVVHQLFHPFIYSLVRY